MTMKNKNRINMKYRPKKCWECGGKLIELTDAYTDGVPYRYWQCVECGDKVLDMVQLNEAAKQYRKIARAKEAKLSKWGSSIAVRIPKEFAEEQKLKVETRVKFLPEKKGFKIIPESD